MPTDGSESMSSSTLIGSQADNDDGAVSASSGEGFEALPSTDAPSSVRSTSPSGASELDENQTLEEYPLQGVPDAFVRMVLPSIPPLSNLELEGITREQPNLQIDSIIEGVFGGAQDDILYIICLDNTNITMHPNNRETVGTVKISMRRSELQRVPALETFFRRDYMFMAGMELLFPQDPHFAFAIVKEYLTLGPDVYSKTKVKEMISTTFRFADRWAVLLRVYKLARGLELFKLMEMIWDVLIEWEDDIVAPNVLTLARIIFGQDNGFHSIYLLKRWCVKWIGKHYEWLRASSEWRRVVENADPILARKWSRICDLKAMGGSYEFIAATDAALTNYDEAEVALDQDSRSGYTSPDPTTFDTDTSSNYSRFEDESSNYGSEADNEDTIRVDSAQASQTTSTANETGDDDDEAANVRAITALGDAVERFFFVDTAHQHDDQGNTHQNPDNQSLARDIHGSPSQDSGTEVGEDLGTPDSIVFAPTIRQTDYGFGSGSPSAVANYANFGQDSSVSSPNTSDKGKENVAPRGVIRTPDDDEEEEIDRWPLPPQRLPPLLPVTEEETETTEDAENRANRFGLAQLTANIETARAVNIVGAFQGGNLIDHVPGSSRPATATSPNAVSTTPPVPRSSFGFDEGNAKARAVMGMDQPAGLPGGNMAGDGARLNSPKDGKKGQRKSMFTKK